MGSMQVDCDGLDDSGCVQDDPVLQKSVMDPDEQVGLLDLSDDVLLYILRHCSPRDLKALGFSCARLGRLVRERSLWREVDARSEQCSRARLCWHLQHTLHSDTRTLLLSGYAKVAAGCLGLANITRKEAEDEKQNYTRNAGPNDGDLVVYDVQHVRVPVFVERHRGRCFFNGQRSSHLARFRGSPTWPANVQDGRAGPPDGCRGPQFTLSRALLRRLTASCGRLTHLALEYCNIDCHVTNLQQFPRTLTKLSLRGSKCFNMTIDKSFLFKIQDYLPVLASLDVSECEWMDPATLLPLSKLKTLQELVMRDCPKLAEFVAYASLTSRYGFKSLKSLDLRGSPIGDSEASALGWLPKLERLWLSAARKRQPPRHLHYTDDERADHRELDDWEKEEPEYFKSKWIEDMEGSEESSHRSVQSTSSAFSSSSTKSEDSTGDSQTSSEYSPPKKRKRYNEVVIGQRTESIDARDGEKYIHTLEIKVTIDDDGEPREKGAGEVADNKKGKTDKKENDSKGETEKGPAKEESPKKETSEKDESPKKGETPKKEDKVKQVETGDAEKGNPGDAGASTSKGAGTSKSDKTEGYVCFRQNRNPIYVNFKKTPTENDETETDDDLDESNAEEPTDNQEKESKPSTSKESDKYVCFRKNRDPVYVNCSPEVPRQNVNYQIEPRHHVLYVNFGPQPSTYRFARDDNEQLRLDFRSSHINPSSLVTDFAIRRFGRANGEDINIFNLGHNEPGINDGHNFRPDRSNLRFLSVTGYRNITDRSLAHLATSAPFLTEIDFTETSITERGAENFRSVRPDCELKYSQFVDREEKKKKDEECVTEFFL